MTPSVLGAPKATLSIVLALALVCFITAVLLTGVARCLAQSADISGDASQLDRRAVELYQQVFSPFCPGRSLNDCPSSKAQDLKLEMRKQLEGGMTPEQVLEGVFSKFGDQYRAVPRYDGFGKLVWWAPLGFIILGALLALSIARGRRSRAAQEVMAGARGSQSSKTAISDDVLTEIERELKDLDQ